MIGYDMIFHDTRTKKKKVSDTKEHTDDTNKHGNIFFDDKDGKVTEMQMIDAVTLNQRRDDNKPIRKNREPVGNDDEHEHNDKKQRQQSQRQRLS